MYYLLFFLSFLMPLAAGCLLGIIGRRFSARGFSVYVNTICAVAFFFVLFGLTGESFSVPLTFGIVMGSDALSGMFALTISFLMFIVSVYANKVMRDDPVKIRFFSFFLILTGLLLSVVFSANLFTMFLYFGMMVLTFVFFVNAHYHSAPACAILGAIGSCAVLCVMRVVNYTAFTSFSQNGVRAAWIIILMSAVLIFSVMAYRMKKIKNSLIFWTCSQFFIILSSLAFSSDLSTVGIYLHTICQSFILCGLFLITGIIENKPEPDMRGMARRMPVTMFCYTLLSFAFIGFPPLSCFISRWYLVSGALDFTLGFLSWFYAGAMIIHTLLIAGYFLPVITSVYFPGQDYIGSAGPGDPESIVLVPVFVTASLSVILGFFSSVVTDFIKTMLIR